MSDAPAPAPQKPSFFVRALAATGQICGYVGAEIRDGANAIATEAKAAWQRLGPAEQKTIERDADVVLDKTLDAAAVAADIAEPALAPEIKAVKDQAEKAVDERLNPK